MCRFPWKPEEDTGSSGVGVIHSCMLPGIGEEHHLGSPEVLLITEPSLQPLLTSLFDLRDVTKHF